MTLSISENEKNNSAGKYVMLYLGISVFCLVFYLIYNLFSHGVHSPYMTFLFAWPLVLGLFPCLVIWKLSFLPGPGRLAANLYHSGVAAVTVSSLLRGIFEIAGTASDYQEWLMAAGRIMLLGGIVVYLGERFRKSFASKTLS